jgi:indole-3-glycerol phosphate synthase
VSVYPSEYVVVVEYKTASPSGDYFTVYAFSSKHIAQDYAEWERENEDVFRAYVYKRVA